MDIPDAWTAESIESAGVILTDDEAQELEYVIQLQVEDYLDEMQATNPATRDAISAMSHNLAGRAFLAGRTYEQQFISNTFPVEMSPDVLQKFLEFLARGEA